MYNKIKQKIVILKSSWRLGKQWTSNYCGEINEIGFGRESSPTKEACLLELQLSVIYRCQPLLLSLLLGFALSHGTGEPELEVNLLKKDSNDLLRVNIYICDIFS